LFDEIHFSPYLPLRTAEVILFKQGGGETEEG